MRVPEEPQGARLHLKIYLQPLTENASILTEEIYVFRKMKNNLSFITGTTVRVNV